MTTLKEQGCGLIFFAVVGGVGVRSGHQLTDIANYEADYADDVFIGERGLQAQILVTAVPEPSTWACCFSASRASAPWLSAGSQSQH